MRCCLWLLRRILIMSPLVLHQIWSTVHFHAKWMRFFFVKPKACVRTLNIHSFLIRKWLKCYFKTLQKGITFFLAYRSKWESSPMKSTYMVHFLFYACANFKSIRSLAPPTNREHRIRNRFDIKSTTLMPALTKHLSLARMNGVCVTVYSTLFWFGKHETIVPAKTDYLTKEVLPHT